MKKLELLHYHKYASVLCKMINISFDQNGNMISKPFTKKYDMSSVIIMAKCFNLITEQFTIFYDIDSINQPLLTNIVKYKQHINYVIGGIIYQTTQNKFNIFIKNDDGFSFKKDLINPIIELVKIAPAFFRYVKHYCDYMRSDNKWLIRSYALINASNIIDDGSDTDEIGYKTSAYIVSTNLSDYCNKIFDAGGMPALNNYLIRIFNQMIDAGHTSILAIFNDIIEEKEIPHTDFSKELCEIITNYLLTPGLYDGSAFITIYDNLTTIVVYTYDASSSQERLPVNEGLGYTSLEPVIDAILYDDDLLYKISKIHNDNKKIICSCILQRFVNVELMDKTLIDEFIDTPSYMFDSEWIDVDTTLEQLAISPCILSYIAEPTEEMCVVALKNGFTPAYNLIKSPTKEHYHLWCLAQLKGIVFNEKRICKYYNV